MKKYAFTLTAKQTYDQKVSRHSFLIRCMPGTYPFQRSYAHKLNIRPFAALTHISDVFGNEMHTGTIDKAHDSFSFSVSGFVLSSKYLTHEPLDRLYLYPTALTQPTPEMMRLIAAASLPTEEFQRAKALCGLVYDHLSFLPFSTYQTAAESFLAREGDARDYAHVLISLCRLNGIPARFVSGLALGNTSVHAWVEVYCGGVWRGLDPTKSCVIEEGYLKIAHGPDYDACAVERSCFAQSGVIGDRTVEVEVTEHIIQTRDTVPRA